MQRETNHYINRNSRTKSVSPKKNEKSNRRHVHSSPQNESTKKMPSKSTSSSSTNTIKSNIELTAKLTRKVYNVNIDNGIAGNKKVPKQIRRMIDDPQQIGVVRRFGEGSTPIFERQELLKKDDTRKKNSRSNSSSCESSGRRRSLSPRNDESNQNKRYDKNKLEKSLPSPTRQSRSRERRLYNKDKKKKSASSPPAKTSYFLDLKREEDRIRQKYGDKKLDEKKKRTRSRSRDRNRKHSRRRSRSSSRSRSRSRTHHSNVAVHPYHVAYYPPPYLYPPPFLPIDPLWRPYPPYLFPPRPPYPPHYLPQGARHVIPGPSGLPPYIRNFRPRFR